MLLLFGVTGFSAVAQKADKEPVVTGKVIQAGMQTSIRGVLVQISGSDTTKVYTNEGRMYKIPVSRFPVALLFTKEPYETSSVQVKRPSDIVIYLQPAKP